MKALVLKDFKHLEERLDALKNVQITKNIHYGITNQIIMLLYLEQEIWKLLDGIGFCKSILEGDVEDHEEVRQIILNFVKEKLRDKNYKQGTTYDKVLNYIINNAERSAYGTVYVNNKKVAHALGERVEAIRANFSRLIKKGYIKKVGIDRGFTNFVEYKVNDRRTANFVLKGFCILDLAIAYYLIDAKQDVITNKTISEYFNISESDAKTRIRTLEGKGVLEFFVGKVKVIEPYRTIIKQGIVKDKITNYISQKKTNENRLVGVKQYE